jgi:probable rRNA maturation factor
LSAVIDVEVFAATASAEDAGAAASAAGLPSIQQIRRLCELAAGSAGVRDGHLAIEFVDERRMSELNGRYRAIRSPTDVLSFPVDGSEPASGERELGDVVICLERTEDVREAIVHGVLHLVGMDHETDDGEMLALQRELLEREGS